MQTYDRDIVRNLNILDEVMDTNKKLKESKGDPRIAKASTITSAYMHEVRRKGRRDPRTGEFSMDKRQADHLLQRIINHHK